MSIGNSNLFNLSNISKPLNKKETELLELPSKQHRNSESTATDKTSFPIVSQKELELNTTTLNQNKDGIIQGKNGKIYKILRPEDLNLKQPNVENKRTKRGRPKKRIKKQEVQLKEVETNIPVPVKVFRTRSGRISKTAQNLKEQDCKLLEESDETEEYSKPFTFPAIEPSKRTISAQYRCGTCNKAYLARTLMEKHLRTNPTHRPPILVPNCNDLWSDLLHRIQRQPKSKQTRSLYAEFETFVHKARRFIPKLLQPLNNGEEMQSERICYVDSICSSALGLPEGKYMLDEARLFQDSEMDNEPNIQNTDQNSLLSLLDTGQVTFDSVTSSSDDVMMNVDQFVNERLKTFTGAGELVETTNGTQNLSLDLSLDMFSYHTN